MIEHGETLSNVSPNGNMICSATVCNVSDMVEEPDLDTPFGRLRWARERAGYEQASDFARVLSMRPVTYRAYESGQNGYAKYAPDFAAKLGIPSDWLMRGGRNVPDVPRTGDLVRTEIRGTGMTPVEIREAKGLNGNATPVPLVGTALGGTWDVEGVDMTELRMAEVLDYLTRPSGLVGDKEAYAVEIVGDSMAPRFEPGERVFVSPRANVRPGDDVIVQLVDPNHEGDMAGTVVEVLIKRFVRRVGDSYELRQFNPPTDFRVPLNRIARRDGRAAIHRVKGRP